MKNIKLPLFVGRICLPSTAVQIQRFLNIIISIIFDSTYSIEIF